MTDLQIIIGKTVEDKLYFRVLTEGGRVLLTSKEYVHTKKCMHDIYAIQQYHDFVITEDLMNTHGYQYTLSNVEGRVLGTSQYYMTMHAMRSDINTINEHLVRAEVIDTSPLIRFFRPVRIK